MGNWRLTDLDSKLVRNLLGMYSMTKNVLKYMKASQDHLEKHVEDITYCTVISDCGRVDCKNMMLGMIVLTDGVGAVLPPKVFAITIKQVQGDKTVPLL